MALKVVTMAELRLDVLTEPLPTGETVADACRRYGISRDTYYRYRRRYLEEGLEGLEDRSRRPKTSPAQIPSEVEIRIVEMRRGHPRWGARRIRDELDRAGVDPPAVSTIHQVLRRNGLVAPQPPRRPRADQRFERDIANDLWQIDATQILLDDGSKAWAVDLIDDHSRYLLAALAGLAATGDLAWDAFELAATRHGLSRQVLSDNGLCFTGRLHDTEVMFEKSLKDLDVELINSAPYHPQTLGSWNGSTAPSKTGSPMKARCGTKNTSKSSSTGSATTTTGNDPTKAATMRPQPNATAPNHSHRLRSGSPDPTR